jgi:NMD protein affecting ribosome stability and mRNA decay
MNAHRGAGRIGKDVSRPRPDRRGTRSDKSPAVAEETRGLADPTVCDACGAIYTRRTWRFDQRVDEWLLAKAAWDTCPACQQAATGTAYGRIVASGDFPAALQEEIRRRIDNVEERALHTQAQRRVLSVDWTDDGFEVLTTSQKLAHRILQQLQKTYGGKTTYAWSDDDGSLYATWTLEHAPGGRARKAP